MADIAQPLNKIVSNFLEQPYYKRTSTLIREVRNILLTTSQSPQSSTDLSIYCLQVQQPPPRISCCRLAPLPSYSNHPPYEIPFGSKCKLLLNMCLVVCFLMPYLHNNTETSSYSEHFLPLSIYVMLQSKIKK